MADTKTVIESGQAVLGIEFGSTRIKAVLVDEEHKPVATGAHDGASGLLRKAEEGCEGSLWHGADKPGRDRFFRDDARLYGV